MSNNRGGKRNNNNQNGAEQYLKKNMEAVLSMHQLKDHNKVKKIVDSISSFVKDKGKNLSSSQLRNLYDKIQKEQTISGLQRLRPKIAYMAARQTNDSAKRLVKFFENTISQVKTEDQLKGFKSYFEAFVAYHKFHHKN